MRVEVENCTGCGYCLLSCPLDAISSDGWARVDEDLCNDCNVCFFVCPNRCLERERGSSPCCRPALSTSGTRAKYRR